MHMIEKIVTPDKRKRKNRDIQIMNTIKAEGELFLK